MIRERSIEWHSQHGRFRVVYPDQQVSQRFTFLVARDYARIFGGKVLWHTKANAKSLTRRR